MALRANQIRFTANDTLQSLRGTVTEDDGSIVPLDGTVVLRIDYANPLDDSYAASTVLEKQAAITDAAAAQYLVEWASGDLRAGTWNYEVEITYASGKNITWNRESTTGRLLEMIIDREIG